MFVHWRRELRDVERGVRSPPPSKVICTYTYFFLAVIGVPKLKREKAIRKIRSPSYITIY